MLRIYFLTMLVSISFPIAAQSGPNFVVIMSDDQGSSDLSLYPPASLDEGERRGNLVHTPNLDSLAEEGVRLERFYVQPYCLPTRASLMTGALHEAWMFRGDTIGKDAIPADTPTIAERFQDAGYQTVLLGKWHVGRAPHAHPNAKGFEHFYGFLGAFIGYYDKLGDEGRHDWQRNGTAVLEDAGEWAPTQLVDEAIALFEERKQREDTRPFMVFLSMPAPHGPLSAPPDILEATCAESTLRCLYRATVNSMDIEVGRFLEALDDYGYRDDTFVIYFTDNGGGGVASNRPFRGHKFDTLEGGVRVGAYARFPGQLRRKVVHHPMQVQDLWATFERAADLDRRAPSTSVDRWRAITGREGSQPWRPMFFSNRLDICPGCCCLLAFAPWRKSSALIVGSWKIHKGRDFEGPPSAQAPIPGTEFVELYHLPSDTREENNLVEDLPWVQGFLSWLIGWWDPPFETL